MLHIRTIDSTKEDEYTRRERAAFVSEMKRWPDLLAKSGWERQMIEAWRNNHIGLQTHLTTKGPGHHLVYVYEARTGIRYMVGKVASKPGVRLELSEVIAHPFPDGDKSKLDDETVEFMRYLIQLATLRAKGSESSSGLTGVWERDLDIVNRTAQPLGCLFSWATLQAPRVLLTANTVGLVHLYKSYGFELEGGAHPTAARYLSVEKSSEQYAKIKWAAINQGMELSQGGRATLASKFMGLRDWVGSSL